MVFVRFDRIKKPTKSDYKRRLLFHEAPNEKDRQRMLDAYQVQGAESSNKQFACEGNLEQIKLKRRTWKIFQIDFEYWQSLSCFPIISSP